MLGLKASATTVHQKLFFFFFWLNLVHKLLRNAGFYLTARNPSTVQLELSQGCLFRTYALPCGVWGIGVSFGPDTITNQLQGLKSPCCQGVTATSRHRFVGAIQTIQADIKNGLKHLLIKKMRRSSALPHSRQHFFVQSSLVPNT